MNEQKTHWRNLTDESHLGSWDLEADGKFKTIIVTIERIFSAELIGQMGKQQKPFIKFKEFQKSMICNKTNFKRLEKRFNSFKVEDYINQQVFLAVEKVSSPEGKVDALRILSKKTESAPQAKKTLSDERFQGACEKIMSKDYTKEQLLSDFDLNDSQHLILESL